MRTFLAFLRANAPWLAAGFLLTFASSFGQTFFISVFAGEIRAEFDLSHGAWGSIYAIATTSSAAVMIWAGSLTDRFRVRHIGIGALIGLALAAASMTWIAEVWMLVAAIFLLRLLGQGLMGHAAMVAMARWFVATRGRAVSVAGLGVAAGEALLPVTFVALLGVFDWRALWLLAAAALIALAPVLWSLLRQERTPQSFAQDKGSAGMHGRMWTRSEALRHPVFWLMLPAILGPAAWNTAFFFQQVHVAEAKGWAHMTLVSLFPLYTATSVVFMLVAGGLVDRLGSPRLAAFYLLPMAAGYLVFALAGSVPVGIMGIVLIGAGVGMHVTMMATFWAEAFGTRYLGSIRAAMAAVMVLGTALGPAMTGAMIDFGYPFPTQSFGIAAYFLIAAAMAAIAGGVAAHGRIATEDAPQTRADTD
ncbi:MAG: MFS transporter [Rhodobacteraceae bacterium]|nr:MFS transporter [Paracoccaceae bacterium]